MLNHFIKDGVLFCRAWNGKLYRYAYLTGVTIRELRRI